jgi:flavin prenyltransferase
MNRKKIIIGISGATGIQYGIRALELLRSGAYETHLIISKAAEMVRTYETSISHEELVSLADVVYHTQDIGAAVSSGSFKTEGMLIAPCSVKTLSEIATGVTSSLLSRAADVVLKERRRLVLLFRETPLHLGHLRSMTAVTEMGGIIMPPVPAFYAQPQSLDEMVTFSVARALDLFGLEVDIPRWTSQYRTEIKKDKQV